MENYEFLEKIGEGTYGEVFKAKHLETGKQVAIKKFKDSYDDEYVRKTALREIRILKELKHDHIVNLIEVFRDQGKIFLVFEYVDRTVLDEIESNPNGLNEIEAKKIVWQLLRSVAFIHDHNIIHRDIKPENLLLSKNGILKM
jgi:cyclin-dependent kinase-like